MLFLLIRGFNMVDYYNILEVNKNASDEVIKMAYKALCRKYHPDVFPGPKNIATKMMQQINEAYDVLSDPVKRKQYDIYVFSNTSHQDTETTSSTEAYSQDKESDEAESFHQNETQNSNENKTTDDTPKRSIFHSPVLNKVLILFVFILCFAVFDLNSRYNNLNTQYDDLVLERNKYENLYEGYKARYTDANEILDLMGWNSMSPSEQGAWLLDNDAHLVENQNKYGGVAVNVVTPEDIEGEDPRELNAYLYDKYGGAVNYHQQNAQ